MTRFRCYMTHNFVNTIYYYNIFIFLFCQILQKCKLENNFDTYFVSVRGGIAIGFKIQKNI